MRRLREVLADWKYQRYLRDADFCGRVKGVSCICCLHRKHGGEHFCIGCSEAWRD